jgi:hypothetical protein
MQRMNIMFAWRSKKLTYTFARSKEMNILFLGHDKNDYFVSEVQIFANSCLARYIWPSTARLLIPIIFEISS